MIDKTVDVAINWDFAINFQCLYLADLCNVLHHHKRKKINYSAFLAWTNEFCVFQRWKSRLWWQESELIEGTEKCTHAIPYISNLQQLQIFQLCLLLPEESFLIMQFCTVVTFMPKVLYLL